MRFRCGKPGHIARYCRLNKKIRSLKIEEPILQQINNLMLETDSSEEEHEFSSKNKVNQLRLDDISSPSSEDETNFENKDKNFQINVISQEEDLDLVFEIINSVPSNEEKVKYFKILREASASSN